MVKTLLSYQANLYKKDKVCFVIDIPVLQINISGYITRLSSCSIIICIF